MFLELLSKLGFIEDDKTKLKIQQNNAVQYKIFFDFFFLNRLKHVEIKLKFINLF